MSANKLLTCRSKEYARISSLLPQERRTLPKTHAHTHTIAKYHACVEHKYTSTYHNSLLVQALLSHTSTGLRAEEELVGIYTIARTA